MPVALRVRVRAFGPRPFDVPLAEITICSFPRRKGVGVMSQQGQVFRLKRTGRGGEPLWAFRYRVGGRGAKRVQRGGFVSERDAADALEIQALVRGLVLSEHLHDSRSDSF